MGSLFKSAVRVIAPIAGTILAPGIGTALGSTLSGAALGGIGGALGGAAGNLATGGGLKGALTGAALGGAGGYLSSGGLGTLAGSPVSSTVAGPTQGSGLLGALTSGNNAVSSGLLSAGRAVGSVLPSMGSSAAAPSGTSIATRLGSVYSGIQGMDAYKDMERAQQAANQRALQTMSPFTAAGQAAQSQLSGLLGIGGETDPEILEMLRNSPGYQFRLEQGQKGLDRSLAARGGLLSGRAIQEAQRLGQGLADQTYNDYVRSLMAQTQMGLGAAAGTAGLQTAGGDISAAARLGRQDQMDRMLAGLLS